MDSDASSGVSAVTVSDDSGTHDAGVENEGDVASSYAAAATSLSTIFFQPRHRWISHPSGTTIGTNGVIDSVAHTTHKHCMVIIWLWKVQIHTSDNTKLVFDAHVCVCIKFLLLK